MGVWARNLPWGVPRARAQAAAVAAGRTGGRAGGREGGEDTRVSPGVVLLTQRLPPSQRETCFSTWVTMCPSRLAWQTCPVCCQVPRGEGQASGEPRSGLSQSRRDPAGKAHDCTARGSPSALKWQSRAMKNMALTAHEWLRWAEGQSGSRSSPGRDRTSERPAEEGACETGEEGQPHGAQGLFGDTDLYPASNERPPRGSKERATKSDLV